MYHGHIAVFSPTLLLTLHYHLLHYSQPTEYSDFWSSTVVEEAESIGLVLACVMGIFMISFKPYFIAKGWLGSKDGRNVLAQGTCVSTYVQLISVTAAILEYSSCSASQFSCRHILTLATHTRTVRQIRTPICRLCVRTYDSTYVSTGRMGRLRFSSISP